MAIQPLIRGLLNTFLVTMKGDEGPRPKPEAVEVVNDASNPIAARVIGTVALDPASNAVSLADLPVAVSVVNKPTVQLDPAANTVKVDSSVTRPVVVADRDYARQPFRWTNVWTLRWVGLPDGQEITSAFPPGFKIPLGKRLVVEYISAFGLVYAFQGMRFMLSNGKTFVGEFGLAKTHHPSGPFLHLTQLVKLYFDRTAEPFDVEVSPGVTTNRADPGLLLLAISGHLVDLQPGLPIQ